MKEYENKLITLSDGYKYVILGSVEYEGKKYALANEVVNNDLGDNLTIFRIDGDASNPTFVVERDLTVIEQVSKMLAEVV